jgi:hypothetical protein
MATGSSLATDESKHNALMNKLDDFDFPYCRDVMVYEKLTKIGQGTFGSVDDYFDLKLFWSHILI